MPQPTAAQNALLRADLSQSHLDIIAARTALATGTTLCLRGVEIWSGGPARSGMARCANVSLSAAILCSTTLAMLAGGDAISHAEQRIQLNACIAACVACALVCEGFVSAHEHCRACAAACRRCEVTCHAVLAGLDD